MPTLGKFYPVMTTEEKEYIKQLRERRDFYAEHLPAIKQGVNTKSILYNTCPACGYPSLKERIAWQLCPICWWEDDGQDDNNENEVLGGPNRHYSLTNYRLALYRKLKAVKEVNTKNSLTMLVLLEQLEQAEKKLYIGEISIEPIKNIISTIDNLPIEQSQILRP